MDKETIDNILAKHFSGEPLLPVETEIICRWKQANEKEYGALQQLLSSTQQHSDLPAEMLSIDVNAAWMKVNKKRTSTKSIPLNLNKFKWIAVAASICLLIGSGIWFSKSYNPIVTFSSGDTSSQSITLADGSRVTLNKNSSLEFQKRMKTKRNVKLTGEAFFEVARNEAVPFIIETNNAQVKVLGTSFNVKTNERGTAVHVKTGKVELSKDNKKIILTAGEQGLLSSGKIEKQVINNENYLAWKTKKLVFDKQSIIEVAAALQEYYNTPIIIYGNAQNCKVSTAFTSETLIQALDELKLLLHFDYKKDDKGIVIYNIECN